MDKKEKLFFVYLCTNNAMLSNFPFAILIKHLI